jgi:hypothetical protein
MAVVVGGLLTAASLSSWASMVADGDHGVDLSSRCRRASPIALVSVGVISASFIDPL